MTHVFACGQGDNSNVRSHAHCPPVCVRKGGGDVADHAAVLMRHEEGRSITRNSADNVRSL